MGRIISKWISSKLITENWFPKFEHFDWTISKLISLLPNQNTYIWEISFLRNQLTDASTLYAYQKCYEN